MFNELFEKIRRVDEIESKLLSIFEGKTWEQIALALYRVLDDIDTADDMCEENVRAFRNMVMKLQAKKNQFLFSPDGYNVKRVDEVKVGDIVQLTHKRETGYKIPGFAKGTVNQALSDNRFLVNFEWRISGKDLKQLANLRADDIEKIDECVCHIYEMDDDKLLEFYRNMDRSYRKVDGTRMETYIPDKREVERELEKRGLEIPVNENLTGHARKELQLAGMFDKEVEGSSAAV